MDGFPDPSVCGETYAATDRELYRRYYGDTIWQPVFGATVEGNLETVKVRQEFPGVILIGGADGFAGILLAKSTDFGETWQDISPFGITLGIDFTGTVADTIFVAASDRVFRSVDGGTTWTTIYQDGISFRFTKILYRSGPNLLYAGGSTVPDDRALLLVSHDLGESWQQIALDELGALVGLEASGEHVYVATRDEGVFRLEDVISGIDEAADRTQNGLCIFPNPASDVATIGFNIPKPAPVTIAIYDPSGRLIKTVLHSGTSAGPQQVRWSTQDLPAGVYVVQLVAGDTRLAARCVVTGT